jgi:hypothetical protein
MIQKENTGLGVVVCRLHDLPPQVARLDRTVDPLPVIALTHRPLVPLAAGLGFVHQLPFCVSFHRMHEVVGDRHAHVEVAQVALVLGVDEVLDVGMIAAQYSHLRSAPRARRLHRLATAVEHAHVRHRATGAVIRAPARPSAD